MRIFIALIIGAVAVGSYFFTTRKEVNPFTGEEQRLALSVEEEITLGLNTAPAMADQFGGLDPDREAQALIDRIGANLLASSPEVADTGYRFEFHLLDDPATVNAFALPGGQVFLTEGLFRRLGSEDEIAGVIGHEIGHVLARHGSEQMARSKLAEGLQTAVVVAGSDDYTSARASAAAAQLVSQIVTTRYGRDDELQSDEIGFALMERAGYDPAALIRVMETLQEASGGAGGPEFLSTHPHPESRIERIREMLRQRSSGPER